jgi:hypothetical protein
VQPAFDETIFSFSQFTYLLRANCRHLHTTSKPTTHPPPPKYLGIPQPYYTCHLLIPIPYSPESTQASKILSLDDTIPRTANSRQTNVLHPPSSTQNTTKPTQYSPAGPPPFPQYNKLTQLFANLSSQILHQPICTGFSTLG